MELHVLGCAGGIGGIERLTTSFLLDDTILLDAGTGLTSLNLDALSKIDHVFITHAHLDHVAGLALLADAVQRKRSTSITVYATQPVLEIIQQYLFNWSLWPDFSEILCLDQQPVIRWEQIIPDVPIQCSGKYITPYSVFHTNGSVGYWVTDERAGFLFTGDMSTTPALWQRFKAERKLKQVIIDCSFTNRDKEIAIKSKHFCPDTLVEDIKGVSSDVEFLIYHLKPGQEAQIMHELTICGMTHHFRAITQGDTFIF